MYVKPTYEEYCEASEYAKFRYRYGVYVQVIAAILLLFLIIYTALNIEEMKANPVAYAEERLSVTCFPSVSLEIITEDRSLGDIKNIKG